MSNISLKRTWANATTDLSAPGKYALSGIAGFGLIGLAGGLIRGLEVHPATAWGAMFELGVPLAVFGAVVGGLVGYLARGLSALRSS